MVKKRDHTSGLSFNGQPVDDYDTIFKKFFPALREYACIFVPAPVAEDIVQDLLVYLWEKGDKLEIQVSLEAYLFRSVYQRCLTFLKQEKMKERHHTRLGMELTQTEFSLFDTDQNESLRRLFMNDLRMDLDAAIDGLPPRCREVFVMSFIEDLHNREISEKLNISSNTVESHITNALKSLRERLKRVFGS